MPGGWRLEGPNRPSGGSPELSVLFNEARATRWRAENNCTPWHLEGGVGAIATASGQKRVNFFTKTNSKYSKFDKCSSLSR